jgi:hypothetical protein
MCKDHKQTVATKLADMHLSTEGSDTASNGDNEPHIILSVQDLDLI